MFKTLPPVVQHVRNSVNMLIQLDILHIIVCNREIHCNQSSLLLQEPVMLDRLFKLYGVKADPSLFFQWTDILDHKESKNECLSIISVAEKLMDCQYRLGTLYKALQV
jgi:hypothetical protein